MDINDLSKRSQPTLHTNPKDSDIIEILVLSGGNTVNVKDLDMTKLNFVFVKYAFDKSHVKQLQKFGMVKISLQ